MTELSNYIHTELNSLLREVQRTPPKKLSSLAKIEALVKTAPLPQSQKKKIKKQIHEIQSAIKVARTPLKSNKNSPNIKNALKTPDSVLQMSEDYHVLQNFVKAKLQKPSKQAKRLVFLQRQYEQVKKKRENRQKYLQQLIIRVQKMQRIQKARARSAEAKQMSQQLSKKYAQKQKMFKQIQQNTLQAARRNRKQTVKSLMQKYYKEIDERSR